MKAIYSFSGLPFMQKSNERFTGGFKSKKAFLACARESIAGARLTFNTVELYTDTEGKKLLKPLLSLFDKVVNVTVDKEYIHFFAYVKLKSYSLQEEPFIHLDFDLILHEKLSDQILSSGLIVEFPEYYKWYRDKAYEYLQKAKNPVSPVKEYFSKPVKNPLAYCTGLFGGNNIKLISAYTNTVLEATRGLQETNMVKDLKTVLFLEQGMVAVMASLHSIKPFCLYGSGVSYKHYIGKKKLEY